jgi:RHS repeat-associated protein
MAVFENWNRYYDPSIGRYLEPEPLLQDPTFVRTSAKPGRFASAYAYAANNPLRFVDPDGRDIFTYDDGAHAGVAFTFECSNMCEANPVVVRIDYRCTDSDMACIGLGLSSGFGSAKATQTGPVLLSGSKLDAKEIVTRCEADCETTRRAFDAAVASCSRPYNLFAHSCRDVVDAALRSAKCGTLPLPTHLP